MYGKKNYSHDVLLRYNLCPSILVSWTDFLQKWAIQRWYSNWARWYSFSAEDINNSGRQNERDGERNTITGDPALALGAKTLPIVNNEYLRRAMSTFHRVLSQIALLGARKRQYWFRSALVWDFTQHRMVVSFWHFGSTYRFHLQGSSSQKTWIWNR